jgi:type II secretory pathway pseudopilin PulG
LLEVLVAMSIFLVALTTLAHLSVVSTRANSSARTATFASLLAVQKMEQLRALAWGFDAFGRPLSDTTTDVTVFPPRSNEGVGLSPSPPGALGQTTTGYSDYLDANGTSLGGHATAPAAAIYIRRWSVELLPSSPDDVLVLQVIVTRVHSGPAAAARTQPDEARIATVKTRTAS